MKKLLSLFITIASIFVVSAGAQSLADIAAQTRARQKANPNAKIIDNDILPSVPESSASPSDSKQEETAKKDSAKSDDKDKKDADKKDQDKDKEGKKDGDKTADASQKADSLKKQIDDQEKEIAQLQREIDVAQREARLRAAAYYADAGTMLRDQGKFAEDSRKLQGEVDAKTQALAAARQKLDDLQEQARKSGIPSSEVQ
jgi:hypothetical protein